MRLRLGLWVFRATLAASVASSALLADPQPRANSAVAAAATSSARTDTGSGVAQASASAAEPAAAAGLPKPNLPDWAFTPATRPGPRPQDRDVVLHVPGSTRGYSRAQISNRFGPPDWFPESHPPAPKIVLEGRKPDVPACGYCHLPNGYGRTENESLAGLPAAYIEQQLDDFKNDRRHRSVGVLTMIPIAKAVTSEEVKTAAEYFASIKPVKLIRVVETDTVPKFHASNKVWVADKHGGTEAIGERVIEMSEDAARFEMRDESLRYIVYAPPGSLKRGEDLVRTGGHGKTVACVLCHGQNLEGMGDFVPSIAGRSPSSMGRQIFDFQTGARHGVNAALMKAPVANLSNADIVAITAYLASLKP